MFCRGITLRVGRGETLAVLGRSGTGKSVLLRLIIGLDPRTFRIDSYPWTRYRPGLRSTGWAKSGRRWPFLFRAQRSTIRSHCRKRCVSS